MGDICAALKLVTDSSSQLSAWALMVIGGSVAAIVGTSYRRPDARSLRLPFLLFIPGWICLGYSLYLSNGIMGKYLASVMVHNEDIVKDIASQVNDIYGRQRDFLLWSLVFFGVWLLIYLASWIFVETFQKGDKK